MIITKIPLNRDFNYSECEDMYNSCKNDLQDDRDFEYLIKNTYFYSFYDFKTQSLIGCIYLFHDNDKLFLNGFAGKKHHILNMECLFKVLNWFDCDIYSNGLHRNSRLCLIRAGFERVKKGENLFIYRRKI